jgi:hypothetical protein
MPTSYVYASLCMVATSWCETEGVISSFCLQSTCVAIRMCACVWARCLRTWEVTSACALHQTGGDCIFTVRLYIIVQG